MNILNSIGSGVYSLGTYVVSSATKTLPRAREVSAAALPILRSMVDITTIQGKMALLATSGLITFGVYSYSHPVEPIDQRILAALCGAIFPVMGLSFAVEGIGEPIRPLIALPVIRDHEADRMVSEVEVIFNRFAAAGARMDRAPPLDMLDLSAIAAAPAA